MNQVISTLTSTGHYVDKSVTDQVCCHWHRAQRHQLKNDVYFWDRHNQSLMLFYRRKLFKNGSDYRIQVYFEENWRTLSDYIIPFYRLDKCTDSTKYEFIGANHPKAAKWVRNLIGGSLYSHIND